MLREVCDALDEAAVVVPELDQLLARWTAEIRAIERLERKLDDLEGAALLVRLRSGLRWLDSVVRGSAVQFERDLAALKAYRSQEKIEREVRRIGDGTT
jgi:hypothetical protein